MTRKRSSTDAVKPFTAEEWAIIRASQASFKVFLMKVFPKSFTGKVYRMADGKRHPFSLGAIHYQWADIAENNPRVCILAPRMHLKSTILNHAFSFWQLFKANENIDGVVVSYKDNLASKHTSLIKTFIEDNTFCRFWIDNKAAAESIIDYDISFGDGLSWEGKVSPYGVLSNVRGLHPKFLICDDILSDFSNPLQPTEIRRIDNVFRSSLESLPDEADSLIVIGTPQSYEDTLYKLKENNAYVWARFPAEYTDPRTQEKKVLWPEKFDHARLMRQKRSVKNNAYQVEYLLQPFLAVNSFIPASIVEMSIDPLLKPFTLDKPFDQTGIVGVYGGMDVGKHVHPTHISVGAKMPSGDVVQVYEVFLEGMDYRAQAKIVKEIIEHFNIKRFYYDKTRAEMEDREMTRRALGVTFSARDKAAMALSLESRFYADETEPGLILLPDDRQKRQIVAVDRTLKSLETADGHGDSFWSIALMLKAADDGPVMQVLGNAQETFGTGSLAQSGLLTLGRGL